MAHKKDPNKTYSSNWGGKRPGSGGTGRPVTVPKRQRNIYVTEEEFYAVKDYLWNVLRKGQSQANRKYWSKDEQKEDE